MLLRRHELDGAIMKIDSKPGLTPGNKLFLYGFLRDAIGCGKQTFLPRVDEALAAEGLTGADLGFPDTRSLMEELAEFAKLTAFKGGRAYVTLTAMPEWDAALEAAAAGGATGKAGGPGRQGKPWKRKKGVKTLKPQRPRRVAREARETREDGGAPVAAGSDGPEKSEKDAGKPTEKDAAASVSSSAEVAAREADGQSAAVPPAGAVASPQTKGDVEAAEDAAPDAGAEATVAIDGSETDADARREASGDAEPESLESGTNVEPAGAVEGSVTSDSSHQPAGAVADIAADDDPQPAGAVAGSAASDSPQPAAPAVPAAAGIALTVTYDPYTGDEGETVLVANAAPGTGRADEPASASTSPAAVSDGATATTTASASLAGAHRAPSPSDALLDTAPSRAALAGYPRDFTRNVHFPGPLLSDLARAMPIHADAASLLTEDFRVARGLGTVRGTRARATFPLRYAGVDGEAVTVTIKRHPGGTQPWTIDRVDGLTDELLADAGIDGLPLVPDGPWFQAIDDPAKALASSPLRRAAARCEVDGAVLEQLVGLAYPQIWSADELRIQVSFALAGALGGNTASDAQQDEDSPRRVPTGLFDALGRPLDAALELTGDDIPWRLKGFEPVE